MNQLSLSSIEKCGTDNGQIMEKVRLHAVLKVKVLFVLLGFVLVNASSCNNNPVDGGKHENRNPVIRSVTVFPVKVSPSDSLVVICDATDLSP